MYAERFEEHAVAHDGGFSVSMPRDRFSYGNCFPFTNTENRWYRNIEIYTSW